MITKKTLIAAAKEVADRAPNARNIGLCMVDRRHPRGFVGRTLHAAGLTPSQIREIDENRQHSKFLNPAATQWVINATRQANSGKPWSEIATTR